MNELHLWFILIKPFSSLSFFNLFKMQALMALLNFSVSEDCGWLTRKVMFLFSILHNSDCYMIKMEPLYLFGDAFYFKIWLACMPYVRKCMATLLGNLCILNDSWARFSSGLDYLRQERVHERQLWRPLKAVYGWAGVCVQDFLYHFLIFKSYASSRDLIKVTSTVS